VDCATRGDPMSPLLWISRSLEHVTEALRSVGYALSTFVVRWTLKSLGYRLQANRKTHEGGKHPDRNAQFLYIKAQKEKFAAAGRPILSIDAKKKEPIGNYKNGGRELCAKSSPEHVNVYDFVDPAIGRATPYGVYDITRNKGWVSVGISCDTGRFAVNTLRQWWLNHGERQYAGTQGILVNADGGGSNGSRVRLWKTSLQEFADEIDVPITVCHYPPGTSKWNPIEHRMFAPISGNWRAKPLRSLNDVTRYIRATTTKTGLSIDADVDGAIYQKGLKITKKQINALNMTRHAFHGEWNYTISPTHAA
jgi:hypothetical protein